MKVERNSARSASAVTNARTAPIRNRSRARGSDAGQPVREECADELASLLRARAQRHQRSMQRELLVILEEALRPRPVTIEELHREARAKALATPSEAIAMVRAGRDGR